MATPALNPTPVPIAQVASHTEQKHSEWHYPQISGPEATIMVGCLTAIVAVVGWVVVHRTALTRDREARAHADKTGKEARKRDLLEVLRRWEQKFVVVTDPDKIGQLYYREGINEIAAATIKFRGDVADKARFDELNVISGMNPQTMDAHGKHQRREIICGAVRNLIAFIQEA